MTAEEVAQELHWIARAHIAEEYDCTCHGGMSFEDHIAAALRDYADTHYTDVLHKWAEANKNAVTNAHAAALEEAVQIIRQQKRSWKISIEAIRALTRGGE